MVGKPRKERGSGGSVAALLEPSASITEQVAVLQAAAAGLSAEIKDDVAVLVATARRLATQTDVLASPAALEGDIDVSTVRHDMRNTLGAIAGYAEMLEEDAAFDADDAARAALSEIRRNGQQLVAALESAAKGGVFTLSSGVVEHLFRSDESGRIERYRTQQGVILVADDDAGNRRLLAQQLRRDGHEVHEAANGAETLARVSEVAPDVVLLDLIMPDMSGFEVLQTLRKEDRLRALRVVMISGLSDEDSAVRCIEGGASDYLIKPVNSTLLRARVGAMLERVEWERKEQAYSAELQRSRDFIRSVFGRYLSDEIVQSLLDKPDGLELGGKTQRVTIVMSDVRGFSQISRSLTPPQLISLLNNYLGPMTEVIMDYGGTVDEFIGDSILAVFGAPIEKPDDCDRALACAVAMQAKMPEINAHNREVGLPEIEMGIGVNTGDVVVGNIGSERRSKYAIVGHQVNLTSRIESCTVGGQILVSKTCFDACDADLEIGSRMTINFKGARQPLELFELNGIGGSFDLKVPERPGDDLHAVGDGRGKVEIRVLRSKLSEGDRIDGEVLAFGNRSLKIKLAEALPALSDISLRFASSDDHGNPHVVFGKITAAADSLQPLLTVTSTPLPLAQLLGGTDG